MFFIYEVLGNEMLLVNLFLVLEWCRFLSRDLFLECFVKNFLLIFFFDEFIGTCVVLGNL